MFTRKSYLLKLYAFFIGLSSVIWFLIRVVPKPSRALYPCQRAAFPIASSFIIWLIASLSSVQLVKHAKRNFIQSRYIGILTVFAGLILFVLSFLIMPPMLGYARNISAREEIPVMKAEKTLVADTYKAKVSIVKSSKANVSQINTTDINALVGQAINMVGGLADIVHDGDTVVIKANLVCNFNYADNHVISPGANGMVTDYRVIQAVVNILNTINPSGKIFLMEGSALGNTIANMHTVGWDLITGLDGRFGIEEISGTWHEYNSPKLQGVDLPDSIALYGDNMKPNKTRTIYLNKIYYDADVLISMPVLKNHLYTGITGSVKNVGIGATPGKIYGTGPSDPDSTQRYGIQHDIRVCLHQWIHDFYACKPVDFVIMDGLQGFDNGPVGYGYTSITQAQKNMRVILAGRDAIAVDAIESLIMAHDPQQIAHLVYLHNDNFGCVNPALINVVGEQVEDIRLDFKISESGLASKFDVFESKDYTFDRITFYNDEVVLKMSDTLNLARVDLTFDGQKYNPLIIGEFNQIIVPLDSFNISPDSIVEVTFVDKYLNTITKTYSGNITGTNHTNWVTNNSIIFPNPASQENFSLYFDEDFVNGKYEIYTLNGKLMDTGSIENQGKYSLQTHLSPGTYFVRVSKGSRNSTEKFILK